MWDFFLTVITDAFGLLGGKEYREEKNRRTRRTLVVLTCIGVVVGIVAFFLSGE